jgi:hypothetical protein
MCAIPPPLLHRFYICGVPPDTYVQVMGFSLSLHFIVVAILTNVVRLPFEGVVVMAVRYVLVEV